jgi:hypothetical protein
MCSLYPMYTQKNGGLSVDLESDNGDALSLCNVLESCCTGLGVNGGGYGDVFYSRLAVNLL